MSNDRWRLILGEPSAPSLGPMSGRVAEQDAALHWLYSHDPDLADRGIRPATRVTPLMPRPHGRKQRPQIGEEGTSVSAITWLDDIHRLFPKETVERLQRDAVETYEITDVVTDPDALARNEPSATLLRAVIRTKHLMDPQVLAMAREMVAVVVRDLVEKLSVDMRHALHGTRSRRRTLFAQSRNFDLAGTIRANLRHFSPDTRQVMIEKPLFTTRTRRHADQWQLILLVDQSGSMVNSVIHSAITAACFWNVPGVRTHLIAYDTNVVDLTSEVLDPVELLMGVQLGGGNDGVRAVDYAATLITNSRRCIVAIISDLYESDPPRFVRSIQRLTDDGVTVLALASLDDAAEPDYDRDIGMRLTRIGVHVGAMTPGGLADFVADCIR
ncbi:VWA domain-containing protein [Williamsia sp.]|uniref:VWA domain-containing protein n=1 Tax=Williamsia sp. TaxID=1872085 RepID=UPI001A2F1060|nr:VWA domain-containing protein [Williamsia sp.]MBJ7287510.1 VWA domain-containing protein [Williamsia sp.]